MCRRGSLEKRDRLFGAPQIEVTPGSTFQIRAGESSHAISNHECSQRSIPFVAFECTASRGDVARGIRRSRRRMGGALLYVGTKTIPATRECLDRVFHAAAP